MQDGDKVKTPPPGVVVRIICDICGAAAPLKKLKEHKYRCVPCCKKSGK